VEFIFPNAYGRIRPDLIVSLFRVYLFWVDSHDSMTHVVSLSVEPGQFESAAININRINGGARTG
jgi:hypothetical protein